MPTISLELIFSMRRLALYRAFERAFDGFEEVQVTDIDIVSIPQVDAVVSPANSFGWMDGGVDQVYVYTFGKQIEERVQQTIQEKHQGELPVGTAFVIETFHEQIPYLVVSPTMKVPGPIRGTNNPYLSLKAALRAVYEFNQLHPGAIAMVGCPGLGTGTGGIAPDEAATQMRQAFTEFLQVSSAENVG